MATVYSSNYKASYVDVPSGKSEMGEYNGRVRLLYGEYTLTGDSTSGDILKFGKIPANARVLLGRLLSADMGGTGTIDLGWGPSVDGVEAANSTGFTAAGDNSGQAFLSTGVAANAGVGKKFAAEVDFQAVLGTSSGATGRVIKAWVEYVID